MLQVSQLSYGRPKWEPRSSCPTNTMLLWQSVRSQNCVLESSGVFKMNKSGPFHVGSRVPREEVTSIQFPLHHPGAQHRSKQNHLLPCSCFPIPVLKMELFAAVLSAQGLVMVQERLDVIMGKELNRQAVIWGWARKCH